MVVYNRVWNYNILTEWNHKYYENVINTADLLEEEITKKNTETETTEFFLQAKKEKTLYLIPSEYTDGAGQKQETIKEMPIKPLLTQKISHRGKAMIKIKHFSPVKIKPQHTITFKELINNFARAEHATPKLYTLWKIIVTTAYVDRINVRVISYPGWLKDSPIIILKLLFGDCTTVNKPSLAKLKYLINNQNKILGLNEVQSLKSDEKDDLAKFYEDTGDFKPYYENPKRGKEGVMETTNIQNLSTLTLYNFPDETKGGSREELFDFTFKPKIMSRIMPLYFDGGSQTETACKEQFQRTQEPITLEEIDYLKEFIKNFLYYAQTYPKGTKKYFKPFRNELAKNVRWQNNYDAICSRIDMYAKDQAEFSEYEQLLYESIIKYLEYIHHVEITEPLIVEEERI